MALTELQRALCRLIAENRVASGESYVAGGVALNELLGAPRISHDVDLFHDTEEALAATWAADRALLEKNGFTVQVLRERASFVEAEVGQGDGRCLVQWARDSAYRFFPLVRHEEFGLVLHPFDLATNKLLALIGRVEVRDWIDIMECHDGIQPLGYLAWAACAKDPGFGPASILEHAARSSHYSAAEVAQLAFSTRPPDAGALSRRWRDMLNEARELVRLLPPEHAGKAVLRARGGFCSARPEELAALVSGRELVFHEGCIRGALPAIMS